MLPIKNDSEKGLVFLLKNFRQMAKAVTWEISYKL
jgi:hypothetical protein